jgi:hypothetical protein
MNVLTNLIACLIIVESGGDDNAVNREEGAYGCLQIREPALIDYNRAHDTAYSLEDLLGDRALSIAICEWYLTKYCPADASAEQYARTWKEGARGHRLGRGAPYWLRVKAELDKMGDRS